VADLIGISSLDWTATPSLRVAGWDHERHLRDELGDDFVARLFPVHCAEVDVAEACEHMEQWGLLKRFARAVAAVF